MRETLQCATWGGGTWGKSVSRRTSMRVFLFLCSEWWGRAAAGGKKLGRERSRQNAAEAGAGGQRLATRDGVQPKRMRRTAVFNSGGWGPRVGNASRRIGTVAGPRRLDRRRVTWGRRGPGHSISHANGRSATPNQTIGLRGGAVSRPGQRGQAVCLPPCPYLPPLPPRMEPSLAWPSRC